MTGGHFLSPSVYKNQSKVRREGTPASKGTHVRHLSFEARTPLTSGVIDLLSSPKGVTEGSSEMAIRGMFS